MSKPSVIIRTLEDSPLWLDQQLVMAYLLTEYWVAWPNEQGCYLTIGEAELPFTTFLEDAGIHSFAIITAYNPQSVLLTDWENKTRNKMLEQELKDHGTLLLPSCNKSKHQDWPPENGFCALGLAQETAIALGKKYEQNAIIWWESGKCLALWWVLAKRGLPRQDAKSQSKSGTY